MDREFLYRFEDDLNRARYEINEQYHMGQADLRARFRLAAAMEQLRGVTDPQPEKPEMSITGLQPGIFQAKLEDVKRKAAERIAANLGKIDAAQEGAGAKVDAAVDGVVAKIDKEADDIIQEFATVTNGGPA